MQFESSPTTRTADRKCTALTDCNSTAYELPGGFVLNSNTNNSIHHNYSHDSANAQNNDRKNGRESSFFFEKIAQTATTDRVCTPAIRCFAEEFVSRLPTPTSDAECAIISTCQPQTEFELARPTPTSDRECRDVAICDGLQTFLIRDSTPTTDRECASTVPCTEEEFEAIKPTPTSDRVCEQLQSCNVGEFELNPPALAPLQIRQIGLVIFTSDRTCKSIRECNEHEYMASLATETTNAVCLPVHQCTSPFVESRPPTTTSDRECSGEVAIDAHLYLTGISFSSFPIPAFPSTIAGLFSNKTGVFIDPSNVFIIRLQAGSLDIVYRSLIPETVKAQVISLVSNQSLILRALQLSHPQLQNAQVGDLECRDEFYVTMETRRGGLEIPTCTQMTQCSYDEFISVLSTKTSDRECSKVSLGCTNSTHEYIRKMATLTSDISCSQLTECMTASEFEKRAPTVTSDRICDNKTQCDPGVTFEKIKPTATSNRVCAPVFHCNEISEYTSTPATLTSNTICKHVVDCIRDIEFELKRPTATSNRICINATQCRFNEWEYIPLTASSDRVCETLKICDNNTEFMVQDATPTSGLLFFCCCCCMTCFGNVMMM